SPAGRSALHGGRPAVDRRSDAGAAALLPGGDTRRQADSQRHGTARLARADERPSEHAGDAAAGDVAEGCLAQTNRDPAQGPAPRGAASGGLSNLFELGAEIP